MNHAFALTDDKYTGTCLAPAGCSAWRWLRGERCVWLDGRMWRPVPGLPPKGSRKVDGVPHVPLRDDAADDEVYRKALCLTPGPWVDGARYVLVIAGAEPGFPRTTFRREDQSDLRIYDEVPRDLVQLREWFGGRLLSGVVWVSGDGRRWVVERSLL